MSIAAKGSKSGTPAECYVSKHWKPRDTLSVKNFTHPPFQIRLTFSTALGYNTTMAQDYDNIGKSLWTDHALDLSRFVLAEEDVEVIADLDTGQQTVIARQTDITKRVRVNNEQAILHVELQLRDSTRTPMWARNAQYQGYLVGEHQIPVYSNVIYFHPNAGRNDPGGYTYSWNGYEHTNRYKVIRLIEDRRTSSIGDAGPGATAFHTTDETACGDGY